MKDLELVTELDVILDDPVTLVYNKIWPKDRKTFQALLIVALRRKDFRESMYISKELFLAPGKVAHVQQAARMVGFYLDVYRNTIEPWSWWHWIPYSLQQNELRANLLETLL